MGNFLIRKKETSDKINIYLRIKITLKTENQIIPLNYQYFLSSVIYDLLAISNLNFSQTLHSGMHLEGSKKFKWFTFSWLQIPQRQRVISNSSIKIFPGQITWFITSPWNEFIQYLVNGLLEKGVIRIDKEIFPIIQVETLPTFYKKDSVRFVCLSPLVITTKKDYNGKLKKYYYRPSDDNEEISEKIRQNLINKYKAFYKKQPKDDSLKIIFDQEYIKKKDAERKITYKGTEIKAIMCPFTAKGSPELINFAYECGFGELNSAGFGMVKI